MKKNNKVIVALCSLAAMLITPAAQAALIEYTISNVSGDTWQYDYTINNELLVDIEEVTIYFDVDSTENLSNEVAPADWDPLVIEPDTSIPDDGFFDVLALVAGVAPGDSLGGFSIQFDFLGGGTPGDQFFEIVDFDFNVIADGFTVLLDDGPVQVPAPGTFWLMLIALAIAAGMQRRREPQAMLAA